MAGFMCTAMALVFIFIMALHEGCGMSLSSQTDELPAKSSNPRRVRAKRCSCNSWDDKECIYFCHLDIIWVNTPSKILPYGLGSPLSRRRRSAGRCQCAIPGDTTCNTFCRKSSENPKTDFIKSDEKSARLSNNKLLQSLRSLMKSNTKKLASKDNHTKVKQLKKSTKR